MFVTVLLFLYLNSLIWKRWAQAYSNIFLSICFSDITYHYSLQILLSSRTKPKLRYTILSGTQNQEKLHWSRNVVILHTHTHTHTQTHTHTHLHSRCGKYSWTVRKWRLFWTAGELEVYYSTNEEGIKDISTMKPPSKNLRKKEQHGKRVITSSRTYFHVPRPIM